MSTNPEVTESPDTLPIAGRSLTVPNLSTTKRRKIGRRAATLDSTEPSRDAGPAPTLGQTLRRKATELITPEHPIADKKIGYIQSFKAALFSSWV
jgi:hypothetical protein